MVGFDGDLLQSTWQSRGAIGSNVRGIDPEFQGKEGQKEIILAPILPFWNQDCGCPLAGFAQSPPPPPTLLPTERGKLALAEVCMALLSAMLLG